MEGGVRTRWPDERLDDLKDRVDDLKQVPALLAAQSEAMAAIRLQMAEDKAVRDKDRRLWEAVSAKLEKVSFEEPLDRMRAFRSQVAIAVGAAGVGGLLAIAATLLTSH